MSLVDCYLLPPTLEVKFVTVEDDQRRFVTFPPWFTEKWCYCNALVVDYILCEHYMCERMLTPETKDWQVFLSEYIVTLAIAWLHFMYIYFRLMRLSPKMGEVIENLPDC